jgi:hypothetical protein
MYMYRWHAAAQLVEVLWYKPEGCGIDFRLCHWNFLLTSFWPNYGPELDSASKRNEYQEYFLGSKGGRCLGLKGLPHLCVDCLEIWEPQPPGIPQGLSRPVMGLIYMSIYVYIYIYIYIYISELHLSGLIWTANYPGINKFRIIWFLKWVSLFL